MVPSQEYLKEILHYCPDSGDFTWIKHKNPQNVGKLAGTVNPTRGYLHITVLSRTFRAHRLAFIYMNGDLPEQIDHINHCKTDNSWKNLRVADKDSNARNRSLRKDNMTGVCGVAWYKPTGKWHARIKYNGKDRHIGFYDDFDIAVAKRKEKEIEFGFHENHGKAAI